MATTTSKTTQNVSVKTFKEQSNDYSKKLTK